ncbi:MAG TPA: GGDEF domain-containing protein [Pyrinomonadaceae bacterium]|nr:GGDEF domain-containing protein [Pyrinomonadaceae bacterium]
MNLDEAIEGLEKRVAEVRNASLTDDRTRLGSVLALRQEERSINEGTSEFDVIIFGDLNDFKHLNDLHGHDAGNVALTEVGEVLWKFVIEDLQGKAYRQSGDEFVILLKLGLLDRFLLALTSFTNIPFSHNQQDLSTSISFGFAISDRKTSFADLLQRADAACQMAKAGDLTTAVEWTETLKLNPLVRISGRCRECGAKITCNVPKENAPTKLSSCPCCGQPL